VDENYLTVQSANEQWHIVVDQRRLTDFNPLPLGDDVIDARDETNVVDS
jgi:hypothetical protein